MGWHGVHDLGQRVEKLIFGNRGWIVALCALLTLPLAWFAAQTRFAASYERMVPASHPYVLTAAEHRAALPGLGNAVRIAVRPRDGTIFTPKFMQTLHELNDEIYLLPGIDRPFMKSLWTPSVRWSAVTDKGFDGGPVMPDRFDGSAESIAALRANVERSGEIGRLVAADFGSTVIHAVLLERDPSTGQPLDYAALASSLEDIRARYGAKDVTLHITGFAKIVGDLVEGLHQMAAFFGVALALAAVLLFFYTRCVRSTALVLGCTLLAVVWLLGLVTLAGRPLNPYSVLVPFLIFAIGVSHGAQKMNGIMQDIGRGSSRLDAAQLTFRRLFLAGLIALLCDAVGFAVLLLVDIAAIRDVATIATLGVSLLVFTNLILLPVLLSYVGVAATAAARSAARDEDGHGRLSLLERGLSQATRPKVATGIIVASVVLLAGGLALAQRLQIGDIDPGAPEFRLYARYNLDAGFMAAFYGASSDVFVVVGRTPPGECAIVANLERLDDFEWALAQLPGVAGVQGVAGFARLALPGVNEGQLKWMDILPDQAQMNSVAALAPRELLNHECDTMPVYAYLRDHKAQTLDRLVQATRSFDAKPAAGSSLKLHLAAGNAGNEAATNEVVRTASTRMLWWVYAAVAGLCLLVFRSWRGALVALVPLLLTSVLCEAVMVLMRIGVKVATLPVIALGVGIGVDYALYVLSLMLVRLRAGHSVQDAYLHSLRTTGKVVMFTALTLSAGVALWVFSPIKFQADMGLLLSFMFLWNMVGALVLLPALAVFVFRGGRRSAPVVAAEGDLR